MKLALRLLPFLLLPTFMTAADIYNCSTAGLTLEQLLVTGSACVSGDKMFSNWTYTPGSNTTVTPDKVTVQAGPTSIPGFEAYTLSTGTLGWTSEFSYGYTVTVLDQNYFIWAASTGMTTTGVPGLPNGSTLTQTLTDTATSAVYTLNVTPTTNPDTVTGLNARTLDVFATGTPLNGTIINTATTYFQATPEPLSMLLLGTGLLGLGFLARLRRR